jgi:glycerate kinase
VADPRDDAAVAVTPRVPADGVVTPTPVRPEMRVLVAPDKFKGSLTAVEVAAAIAEGLERAGVPSRSLPLADGGDGSVDSALTAGFAARTVPVRGADGRQVETAFAFDGTTAVVEVATTCGWRPCLPASWRP